MRIAGFVNHQTVERILHFFAREVSLFECVLQSHDFNVSLWGDTFSAAAKAWQCPEEQHMLAAATALSVLLA